MHYLVMFLVGRHLQLAVELASESEWPFWCVHSHRQC